MFLEIDTNNKINQKEKNFLEITNNNNNLYIYGEIDGFFENKNFLNKEETISILKSNLHDINKIKKNLLNILGKCFILLKTKEDIIYIFNSIESQGFFYASIDGKIYIGTKTIDVLRKFKKYELNDYELINYISLDFNKISTFTTIFENLFRLPSGYFLEIKKKNQIKSHHFYDLNNFCNDKRSLKKLDSEFKFFLEESIKFKYKKNKNLKLYSHLSCGIDSTIVTIACKKLGYDVTALHHTKHEWISNMSKVLSKKIGVKLAFIFGDYNLSINKWWDEYRSNDDTELKKDLGMLPFANIFMTDFYKKKNFISFGGAALGQNYQIHTGFKPEFGMNTLVRFVQNLKRGFFHRFLSTKAFIYLLNFPIIIKSLELIFNMRGRLPKNQLDYLAFLSVSATTPFLPSFDLKILNLNKELFKGYIDYFTKLYMKNYLDEEDFISLFKNKKTISNSRVQKYARLICFTRGVFNNKYQDQKITNKIEQPGFFPPFSNFLLSLNIGFREVFFPKALHFRYFKNELKWDYHKDFLPTTYTYKNVFFHTLMFPIRFFKKKINKISINEKKNFSEVITNSDDFKKKYSNLLNINNSKFIPHIKNKDLKKYFTKCYLDIINEREKSFYRIVQIINLEFFFRELHKDKI